jgi:microcystin-dependent protein
MSVENTSGYQGFPIPVGCLFPFAGIATKIDPTQFILCDGRSLKRSEWAELFSIIGTIYGAVDGLHFSVPNTINRYIKGTNVNANVTQAGGTGGALTSFSIVEANMPDLPPYNTIIAGVGIDFANPVANISGNHQYLQGNTPTDKGANPPVGLEWSVYNAGGLIMNNINVDYVPGSLNMNFTPVGPVVPAEVAVTTLEPAHFAMTYYIKARY